MTQWTGAQIAHWLRESGLDEDQVVHGVALSLAATEGCDHYRANVTAVPEHERQGLFALRRADVVSLPDVDLFDPRQSCAALAAAYADNGNRWDWHPVHLSGAALRLEPMVRLMVSDRSSPAGAIDSQSMDESLHRMMTFRRAMQQAGGNSAS